MRRMVVLLAAGLLAAAVGCSNCTHGVCDCEGPPPSCIHAEPTSYGVPAPGGVAVPAPLHAEPVPPPKVIIEK